jgi:hypothetical protein
MLLNIYNKKNSRNVIIICIKNEFYSNIGIINYETFPNKFIFCSSLYSKNQCIKDLLNRSN